MELGRTYVIDVSQTTIQALKIVAAISLLLLLTAVVKMVQSNMIPVKFDNGGRGPRQQERRGSAGGIDPDQEKKYWKKELAELERRFPSSNKASSMDNVKKRDEVSDKNIGIKKKQNPILPKSKPKSKSGKDQKDAIDLLTNPDGSINLDDSELLGKKPKKTKKKRNDGQDENTGRKQ